MNLSTTRLVEFAIIGVQLCSSMTATFLQRHFFLKLNGPRFFFNAHMSTRAHTWAHTHTHTHARKHTCTHAWVCIHLNFGTKLILVSGYFGDGNASFLIKGIFSFFIFTILVPVETELVLGFGSLSSPRTTRLVQWLSWVFNPQERKKERKKVSSKCSSERKKESDWLGVHHPLYPMIKLGIRP